MKPATLTRGAQPGAAGPGRGSALIVILWIVGLLSMLVSSMAFDAHIEARIMSYYRKRTKAEYLARSGVEIARMLLAKRAQIPAGDDTTTVEDDPWYDDAKRLKKMGAVTVKRERGDGTVTLEIVPEPARRNINNLDLQNNTAEQEVEENMERILEVGGITEDTDLWPTLIDSLLDWTDKDDKARANGAETDDYYATLKPPYKAANSPLETVEELLLVKGYTRTILFGGTLKPATELEEPKAISGIADLLTTYGDGKVNINSASQRVLMTLPGVDELVAGAILEERAGLADAQGKQQEAPFKNENELFARIPELDPVRLRKYITTADSTICRITSAGEVQGVQRKVWCIGEYANGKMTIYRWWEGE